MGGAYSQRKEGFLSFFIPKKKILSFKLFLVPSIMSICRVRKRERKKKTKKNSSPGSLSHGKTGRPLDPYDQTSLQELGYTHTHTKKEREREKQSAYDLV